MSIWNNRIPPHDLEPWRDHWPEDETTDALTKTNEMLVKISDETDHLLREIERLKQELANDDVRN
jgi:hypothetical protein